MNIVKAKRILESAGCKLVKEWSSEYEMGYGDRYMDRNDYEEKYCPIVGNEFDKITLKMKENLKKEFPGTEIKEFDVEFEDVDTFTDYPEFTCKVVFSLAEEVVEDPDKVWELAKSGIKEANDSWYYESDFDGNSEILNVFVPCTVKEENEREGGYSRAFLWK